MRAVVQRVKHGDVAVGDHIVGAIGQGLLVFLGVSVDDGPADVQYMADKIRNLRIFDEQPIKSSEGEGSAPRSKMNRSVVEIGGSVLVVSQFTLYGDCRKGRRPSFDKAARPDVAQALYGNVVRLLRDSGLRVETGAFQALMDVRLVNEGPVTLLIESRKIF